MSGQDNDKDEGGTACVSNEEIVVNCHENQEDSDIPLNMEFYTPIDDGKVTVYHVSNDVCLNGMIGTHSDYVNFGMPDRECIKCGAKMWYEERTQKDKNPIVPDFSMCCKQGTVKIAYPPLPEILKDLYYKNDRRSKFFMENIRSFNGMFAFTSMGGNIDSSMNEGGAPPTFVLNGENYHQIGSLLPQPGNQPKFAQLYIYDTDNEIKNRMASVGMVDDRNSLKSSIVEELRHSLDVCNSYVKTYRTARDKLMENNHPTVKLRILGKRNRDGRTYNFPTASEVAALIVGDFDSSDFDRDIVVEERNGFLKRISIVEPSYFPLQYPLLFPMGEDGYRKDIEYQVSDKKAAIKTFCYTKRMDSL